MIFIYQRVFKSLLFYCQTTLNGLKAFCKVLILIMLSLPTFSQVPDQVQSPNFKFTNALTTSPEAAMLGKFGAIPIGYYTGTASVSIPIYTIKEGGLEIPIELRYHGSGNKVEEQASNVGLGWSLEPGGSIIQIANGVVDSAEILNTDNYAILKAGNTGFSGYTNRWAAGTAAYPCYEGTGTGNDLYGTSFRLLQGDGQPDIYQYNFPGGNSGKFYIDNVSGDIILINKSSDIRFVKVNPTMFTARTLDGTKFTFAAIESSYSNPSYPRDYTGKSWKLTEILFANKKNIRFTYSEGYSEWVYYKNSYHSSYPLDIPNTDYSYGRGGTTEHHIKYLDSIITSDAIIKFNLEDRADLPGSADMDGIPNNGLLSVKRIKSIDIKDRIRGLTIKSFNLAYDYFAYQTAGGDYTKSEGFYGATNWLTDLLGKRLKLLSVQETVNLTSGTALSLPPYLLEYDESVIMPLKTSFARDYWGYYNGRHFNSSLMPDFTTGKYSTLPIHPDDKTVLDGLLHGNREPDSTYIGANLLKKIVYPTGGFSQFDYEVHHYNINQWGGGMRISRIRNYTAPDVLSSSKRIKYLLANNTTSGVLMSELTFANSTRGEMYFEKRFQTSNEILDGRKIIWYASSESVNPYSDAASGGAIGYSRVIEEEEVAIGRQVFTYYNEASLTADNMPDIPDLMNGKLLKEELFNAENSLLKETKYNYSSIASSIFTGVKIRTNFYIFGPCQNTNQQEGGTGTQVLPPDYPLNGYDYLFYPIISKWILPVSVETRSIEGSDAMLDTISYTYNIKGQQKEEHRRDSKQLLRKTTFLYPIDALPNILADSNRFDKLLEKRVFVAEKEISKTTIGYRAENNQLVQSGVLQSNDGGITSYSEVDYNVYGPKESLLQLTTKGLVTSIIWTDTYDRPIAEVLNAEANEIAYTGFERNDSGNWEYDPIGIVDQGSRSGHGFYQLSSNLIQKSGLSSDKKYIISYWTTNQSAYSISGTQGTPVQIFAVNGWKHFQHEVIGLSGITISGSGSIDDLRLYPAGAQMTSYTYRPLVGMISKQDAKGQAVFYEYDELSRLKMIKDHQGSILKTYEYHYKQ